MSIKERLLNKKMEMEGKITKARIESLQSQDAKLRRKKKFVEKGTVRYGLAFKQHPFDLMKDAIERRKERRESKIK